MGIVHPSSKYIWGRVCRQTLPKMAPADEEFPSKRNFLNQASLSYISLSYYIFLIFLIFLIEKLTNDFPWKFSELTETKFSSFFIL
jgi:hypothetical protein